MTNREIVSRLRELGHTVEVYVRKDGSIRVTAIDGTKYSSRLSEGVAAARDIYYNEGGILADVEAARYEAAKKQREAAQASRASGDTLRSQSKEFQARFKKLQAKSAGRISVWRKRANAQASIFRGRVPGARPKRPILRLRPN